MDTDGNEHRLGADDAGLPHLLVAGIKDEIGVGFLQAPLGEGSEGGIETLIDPRFSIRTLRRAKYRRKVDRKGKGLRAVPEAFHPLTLVHGEAQFKDVFTAFGGRVARFSEELKA